jgi:3-carboxy-cis,cis-muconate cycloisomerase
MAQEHERAAGGWQAEWSALPDLFRTTAGAIARVRDAVRGLQVDTDRMQTNLDLGGGLLMSESLMVALARHIGRPDAQRLVQAAASRAQAERLKLRQVARDDTQIRAILSPEEIDRALDPAEYLGSADSFIDRALASYHEVAAANTILDR